MAEQVARLWLFCLFPWVVEAELTYIAIRLPLKVCLVYEICIGTRSICDWVLFLFGCFMLLIHISGMCSISEPYTME